MEATAYPAHPLPKTASRPEPENWDWVYEDPDLAPFLATNWQVRKEMPLTFWT